MNENNPFCENCKEKYCMVSLDGTCAMIRFYLNAKDVQKPAQTNNNTPPVADKSK